MKNFSKTLTIAAAMFCVIVITVFLWFVNAGPGSSYLSKNYRGIDKQSGNTESPLTPEGLLKEEGVDLTPDSRNLAEIKDDLKKDQYQTVLIKYTALFSGLQSEYTGKLNNVLQRARSEIAQKGQGQKEAILKISLQYVKEAKALEKECDARFYATLNDMEQELRQKSLPLDMVDGAEKQYKQQKKERQRFLSTKALEYIKGK